MGIYIGLLRAEKDTMDKQKILFIGNHFHDKRVWEEIPEKLKNDGHFIITTSAHKCRVVRILDMLFTTLVEKIHTIWLLSTFLVVGRIFGLSQYQLY